MATRLAGSTTAKALSARGYAAQAAVKSSEYGVLPKEALKTSTLANGVLVASVENHSPLSRVAIAFRAGSRYESFENQGASHLIRVAASISNAQDTSFSLTRRLQQVGASLACTSDREVLIYSADATRNHLEEVLELLANAATRQTFKPWELEECLPRVKLDLALAAPQTYLMEDLHTAGYRQSDLGRSLLASPHALSALSPAHLASHLSQTLMSGRLAVVGTGVDHAQLTQYAQSLSAPKGEGSAPAAKFGGGEVRAETGGQMTLVAVAAEGAGASSGADAVTQAVLQAVLGAGPVVKYGGGRGLLGTAAADCGAAAAAVSATYSDSSLVGYTVAAEASKIGKALDAVNKAFKTASLTEADLSRGKALVKSALLKAEDCSGSHVESMAVQAATLGGVTPLADALKAVDAVTLSNLQTLHKKVAGGKLCMAARGNLQHVPYLDQL